MHMNSVWLTIYKLCITHRPTLCTMATQEISAGLAVHQQYRLGTNSFISTVASYTLFNLCYFSSVLWYLIFNSLFIFGVSQCLCLCISHHLYHWCLTSYVFGALHCSYILCLTPFVFFASYTVCICGVSYCLYI